MPPDDVRTTAAFREVRKDCVRAAADFDMLAPNRRVLVGVSGGEDSLCLMHLLTDMRRRAPFRFALYGVTVDMGFDDVDIEGIHAYCQAQGWNHRVVSFPGQTMIEQKGLESAPCSLCARMRRGQIHHAAHELGCDTIALGQHLDDVCASFLLALFRGQGVTTMAPTAEADAAKLRLIRPLCRVSKARIHELAARLELPSFGNCDYHARLLEHGDRAYVERLLASLEERFPDIRQAMAASMANLQPAHLLDPKYSPFARGC